MENEVDSNEKTTTDSLVEMVCTHKGEMSNSPMIAVECDENDHAETVRIVEQLVERMPKQRIGIIGHTSRSKRELGLILAGLDLQRRVEIVDSDVTNKRIHILEEPSTEHPKLDLAQLARRMEYRDRIDVPHYTAGIGDNRGEKRARKALRPRWRR